MQKQIDALLNRTRLSDPSGKSHTSEKLEKLKECAQYNENCRNELANLRCLHSRTATREQPKNQKYSTYNAPNTVDARIKPQPRREHTTDDPSKSKTWPEGDLRSHKDGDDDDEFDHFNSFHLKKSLARSKRIASRTSRTDSNESSYTECFEVGYLLGSV